MQYNILLNLIKMGTFFFLLLILVVYILYVLLKPDMYSMYPFIVLVPLLALVLFRPDRTGYSSSRRNNIIDIIDTEIAIFLNSFYPRRERVEQSAGRRHSTIRS